MLNHSSPAVSVANIFRAHRYSMSFKAPCHPKNHLSVWDEQDQGLLPFLSKLDNEETPTGEKERQLQ